MFIIYKLYVLVSFSIGDYSLVYNKYIVKQLKMTIKTFPSKQYLRFVYKRGFFNSPSKSHKNQIESNSIIAEYR